ncbi:MAG: sterol desaturase/sphingolipid hydroxylase (fatty acid hydroxylase superfamily) [Kiritimatiellia bacterium]|jgi:sterol desaturase/sphingolipid hydroxylase (fatty acid hydroxylase superfamily)
MHKPIHGLLHPTAGVVALGALFFLIYSFFNYWWHRLKHSNPIIWRYIHRFHHVPSKMEVALIFFKHPLEIVANSLLIYSVVWCGYSKKV